MTIHNFIKNLLNKINKIFVIDLSKKKKLSFVLLSF